MKRYDRRYFDRWYRQCSIDSPGLLRRKVALATAQAEYYLQRPIRRVLDIGCGEGRWRAPLLALRPHLHYLGFDHSPYAVARFGSRRQIAYAKLGDFAVLRPCPPVDLLICADVLHYVPSQEIRRALPGLAELCAGLAYLETMTADDPVIGDVDEFQPRSAQWYRRHYQNAGFVFVGSHCWLAPTLADTRCALERCSRVD